MKILFPLCLQLALAAPSFAAEPIRNRILTQDLAHTPRLFQCMKELVADIDGQGFHGPFFTKSATGGTDRTVAAYIIRTPHRDKYYWYLKAAPGSEFRLFTYEAPPMGLAIGMFGTALNRESVVTDEVKGKIVAKIDLSPCAQFLGKP